MALGFEKVTIYEWEKRIVDYITPSNWLERYTAIKVPQRTTRLSAGYDFHAPFNFVLEPGDAINIPTGIKVQLEPNQFLMIAPRSSLGFKYYFRLANTVGIIDADYYGNKDNEGHIFIKIRNEGPKTVSVSKGDGIAQGIIMQYSIIDGDTLDHGRTRPGGIGSTDN